MGLVRKAAGEAPQQKMRRGDCRRKLVTEGALKGLKAGQTASDSLPGQGSGAILFEAREGGVVDAYFRTIANGKSQKIKIGRFKKLDKHDGLTLEQIRNKAREFSSIALEHGNIKDYLKAKKATEDQRKLELELAAQEEARRLAEASSCGTLAELFEEYILHIQDTRSKNYVKEIQRCLKNIRKDFPELSEKHANEVGPEHLYEILLPVWQRGSRAMSDKLRTYLKAAYNFGLKNDYSLEKKRDIFFRLESNPANFLPRNHKPKAITTSLNPEELNYFWHSMRGYTSVGPVIRIFLLFIIATGGQRIEQVLREPWTSYDLEAGLLHTTHKKGKNDPRLHLVPLTDRAIQLLTEVKSINPYATQPWTTNGKKTLNINTIGDAVESWLKSEHSKLDRAKFKKFTPRDLRRTCKQIMQALRIPAEDSNILQCHDISGVALKNYNNESYAFIPSLRRTIEKYDRALEKILNGDFSDVDYYKYKRKSA